MSSGDSQEEEEDSKEEDGKEEDGKEKDREEKNCQEKDSEKEDCEEKDCQEKDSQEKKSNEEADGDADTAGAHVGADRRPLQGGPAGIVSRPPTSPHNISVGIQGRGGADPQKSVPRRVRITGPPNLRRKIARFF